MNNYRLSSSSHTGRACRSVQEAFGAYTSYEIHTQKPGTTLADVVISIIGIVSLVLVIWLK